MYNPHEGKVMEFIHDRATAQNFKWFTAGEVAREKNVSVPTARKYMRSYAERWQYLIDVAWEDYRPNAKVQLFRIAVGK